ncbi:MAG: DUF423 domain-containing protein, partial [Bacteroidia bacterium]|nr:DUF423 domain-containing protein [Bacteroidia bacterium]
LAVVGALSGLVGIIGATLHSHVRPIPALGQAAYIALFHAPVLLWLSKADKSGLPFLVGLGFSLGCAFFTGSIYLRYLASLEKATILAPVGGGLLIFSWAGLTGWAIARTF